MAAEYTGRADSTRTAADGTPAGLRARLRGPGVVILDGATGTELEHRGLHTGLPLWSTHALIEAPETVAEIHRAYREAGAELITANTFRTQRRVLARVGRGDDATALTSLAVSLAREAAPPFVLGSAPPLEDCYRPDLVPDDASLVREHHDHAEVLARAGVDGIAVETMNDLREARAAAAAARATGLPFFVSFTCGPDALLLSGLPLAQAIGGVADFEPEAIAVNCMSAAAVDSCMPELAAHGLRFGAYPNHGEPDDRTGFTRAAHSSPSAFAACAEQWLRAGATLLGGCCGTTPDHIRAIAPLSSRN